MNVSASLFPKKSLRAILPALVLCLVLGAALSLSPSRASASGLSEDAKLLAAESVAVLWSLHVEGIGPKAPAHAPYSDWYGKVVQGRIDQDFLLRVSIMVALCHEKGLRTVARKDAAGSPEAARAFGGAPRKYTRFLSYEALENLSLERFGWKLDRNAIPGDLYTFFRKGQDGLLIDEKDFWEVDGGLLGNLRPGPCTADVTSVEAGQGGWILRGAVREFMDESRNPGRVRYEDTFRLLAREEGGYLHMENLSFALPAWR